MLRTKTAIEFYHEGDLKKMVLKGAKAIIFKRLIAVGHAGITTRDFPGWDVRSHIKRMKDNSGIRLEDKKEKNELGGYHKRWWLEAGYHFKDIPYPKRKKPGGKPGSNPNSDGQSEGSLDG